MVLGGKVLGFADEEQGDRGLNILLRRWAVKLMRLLRRRVRSWGLRWWSRV